jgi:dsDNA-binding SOS-regulon protein
MIKHKFRAVRTELDGIKFASKKEAKRYKELVLLKHSGEVLFFLRQVPIHLPANVRYVLDYLIFWANGEVTFEDVKGMKTAMYILKKKQVEALYPIKIMES